MKSAMEVTFWCLATRIILASTGQNSSKVRIGPTKMLAKDQPPVAAWPTAPWKVQEVQ